MKIGPFLSGLYALCVSIPLAVPVEAAQSVEDFYKSKRLTVLVGSGAGGGYDIYARLLMRHMVKHIPGHPATVVQNQDGAAGVHATNLLANKSDRDGSVILATYNNLTIQPLLNTAGIQYDPRTLSWIGSIAKLNNVCITWHTSSVKTFEQAKERQIILSSTGVTSNSTAVPNLLNRLVGTKFKVINGYSTSAQRLAVERGEAEGMCLAYSTFKASNPEWIQNKKINLLVQVGLTKHPDIPEVPLAMDFLSDQDDKRIMELLNIPQEMGRPMVAPPDIPMDRLQALRRAFDATMKDPDYLAESERAHLEVDPMTGEAMTEMIQRAYALPQALIARATDLNMAEKN
jgi:tripartite-type tricarboxylate transporter receptor subunit TctC